MKNLDLQQIDEQHRRYYLGALMLGLVLHGATLYFTIDGTYDAFVHQFFADHYANHWFESWDFRWYTGFTITSYPPLVHQVVALLSKLVGLKLGFLAWSMLMVGLFIRGVYHFSQLWVSKRAALYAAFLAVFSTSFGEAFHIFGQLPSITGATLLLNACPEIYRWLRYDDRLRLYSALSLIAVISTAHHVSTIFGMVFFVMPVMGLAVWDRCVRTSDGVESVHFIDFLLEVRKLLPRLMIFGVLVLAITLTVIFPYWYWSKSDPISQVSIPHGSRDSFLEQFSSGLMFFLIPWALMLFFLPYLFVQVFRKRNIFLGLSVSLCFLLGTGGTTPLPKMILGETAFEILTLDRFTFWATLMALPFWGAFFLELNEGGFRDWLENKFGPYVYRFTRIFFIGGAIGSGVLVINFQNMISLQPQKIDIDPIVSFLERDEHDQWRFLTLGFGDQMARLSAHTDALSVDGNYHSARRLPELTSRAIERLENAKYLGLEGITSLQQFLTVPEKYSLKFIFSNDKFYDPLLFFSGWHKVAQLDNHIVVWERPDQPKLPSMLPRKNIPLYQRLMWGILPLTALVLCVLMQILLRQKNMPSPGQWLLPIESGRFFLGGIRGNVWILNLIWILGLSLLVSLLLLEVWRSQAPHASKENVVQAYYEAIDHKKIRRSYDFFDPDQRPPLSQYLLEHSVEGGILASYAKLDSIAVQYEPGEDSNTWMAKIEAHWLTALFEYTKKEEFRLQKKGASWYLTYPEKDLSKTLIPPDQFLRAPSTEYHSQGRRKTSEKKTSKKDVLDRPDIYILSASLVQKGAQYHVVGELVNVDNDPAYVSMEAILYDRFDQELARYNARDILIHDLLPKESSPFRIDFEQLTQNREHHPPVRFVLFVRSMVTGERMYKSTGLKGLAERESGKVNGELINYGPRQILIPELILSQYDEKGRLWWVSAQYLSGSIRSQRKVPFELDLTSPLEVCVLQVGEDDNLLVNGVARREYLEELNPDWLLHSLAPAPLAPVLDSFATSLRISVNPLPVSVYEPR